MTQWLLLFAWIVSGCAHKNAEPSLAYAPPPQPSEEFGAAMAMDDAEFELDAAASRGIDTSGRSRMTSAPPPAEVRPTSPKAPPAPDRMVHYDGWARMRVTRAEETLDAIAALAVDAGGRVDRLSGRDVSVRVPVDAFRDTWKAVLELGDILDKSVRADDITEQFLAVDLRVRTLQTMQNRLVKLLGRAKSDEEKLALLQQITRVTEELDSTRSMLNTLRDLAAMSTIRVEAVPREAFAGRSSRTELDGFGWIGSLSPFNHTVWDSEKRVDLSVPDEMVVLSKRGPWIAESADGAVLWTMKVPNDPQGTGDFWASAIQERIGEEFEGIERSEVGSWACLAMQEPGADAPYRWDVCIENAGRHLHVTQAYYPGPEQVDVFADRVSETLKGTGGDS